VRAFAKAEGLLAKTDRLDARLLARFGARMRPAAVEPPDEKQAIMDELAKRREQLMQMRTAELNRLKTARYAAREYIKELLKYIEQQLAKVEQQINELMQQSEQLSAARKLLMSVPGVGPVTANILLIRLPEILTLGPKAVAALAGLAPMANQSGSKDKRRRIHGGRQDVRNVLYSVGDALQPGHQALLSAADRAREGRTGGGHAQASAHLECDAQAQSAVEAELVSKHPLTFNTVTSMTAPFLSPACGGIRRGLPPHAGELGVV
jgi:transposase